MTVGLNILKITVWTLLDLEKGIYGYLIPYLWVREFKSNMTLEVKGQGHVSCCVRLGKIC